MFLIVELVLENVFFYMTYVTKNWQLLYVATI